MPPLNKEALQQIATGEISDRLKFARFSLIRWNEKASLSNPGEVVGQVVYFTPNSNDHLSLREELEVGPYKLTLPDGVGWIDQDAGRIMRVKTGGVLFYGHSSGMEIGDNPVKRKETALFVRDKIAEGEIPVGWKMG